MRRHLALLAAGLVLAGLAVVTPAGARGGAVPTTWVPTLPNGASSIQAFPDGSAFVHSGKLMWRSTDRGNTWLAQPLPVDYSIVKMATPQVGFVVDEVTQNTPPEVYRTLDGGATWHPADIPWRPYGSYAAREIITSDDGRTVVLTTLNKTAHGSCAAGFTETQMYVSHDAGDTWDYRPLPAPGYVLHGDFSDARTGVVVVQSEEWSSTECYVTASTRTFWLTRNGGTSFTRILDDAPWFLDIELLASGRIVVLHAKEVLLGDDLGRTWRTVRLPEEAVQYFQGFWSAADLDFADATVGYATGSFGHHPRVFRTEDGGENWSVEPVSGNYVGAIDATAAVVGGELWAKGSTVFTRVP